MAVIEGRTKLEVLSQAECWALVAQAPLGRVAVVIAGTAEIYPVNHKVDGHAVVFRSDPGSKLRGLLQDPRTSFEVDGTDAACRNGWSVLVKGRATELRTGEEAAHAATLGVAPWPHGEKSHWIRIDADEITGRRIRHPEATS